MCFLKVLSDDQSFKSFAQNTAMPVFAAHDKGEFRDNGKEYEKNQLSLDVSDADWDGLDDQIGDAIAFLKRWRVEVKELITSHSLTDAYLDFPLNSRLGDEIGLQNERPPKELIQLCGELGIGIELGIYAKGIFEDEAQQA